MALRTPAQYTTQDTPVGAPPPNMLNQAAPTAPVLQQQPDQIGAPPPALPTQDAQVGAPRTRVAPPTAPESTFRNSNPDLMTTQGFIDDVGDAVGKAVPAVLTGGASELPGTQHVLDKAENLINGPDAPPPPDIEANKKANIEAARATAQINNPNIVNQYGSTTYTDTPDGRSTMTQTLNAEEQALYEAQRGNKQSTADLAQKGLKNLSGTFGTEFDISGAPGAPKDSESIRKGVVDAMMSRNDPRLQQAAEQQDSDLIAAGIRPGTKAWERAKTEQGQNRNDALMQAQLAGGQESSRAFGQDTESRKNYISELLQKRQVPLNEINALLSGSQQANPFAGQGFQGGANVASTAGMLDQYNQNVYNQQMAGRNAIIGGVVGAGTAAIASDRRLKTEINRVGTHKLGIGLYTWKYLDKAIKGLENDVDWGKYSIGVMADELKKVMPEAVVNVKGYDFVNYGMIGA